MVIAVFAFKESVSRRAWIAILLITCASALLSLNVNAEWGLSAGGLGILAACTLWGMDNNFTRNIAEKDPLTIVMLKGLVARLVSLSLAFALGNHLPNLAGIAAAMVLGGLGYGVSIILFILAMRGIGAARTSALYGTAPFGGMTISFLLFHEPINFMFMLAILFMITGTMFLVHESHEHKHMHPSLIHEHSHAHDEGHHNHEHDDYLNVAGKHSREHEHPYEEHDHQHMPDIHHRHTHRKRS